MAPKEPRPVGANQPLPRGRRAPFLGLFLHQFVKVVFLLLHSQPPPPPARWILLRHMLVAVKREVSQLDSSLSGKHVVQQQFIFLRDGECGTCEPPVRGGFASSFPPRLAGESPPRNAGGFGSLRPPRAAPCGSEVPVGTGRELQKPRTPSSGLKFHAREVFLWKVKQAALPRNAGADAACFLCTAMCIFMLLPHCHVLGCLRTRRRRGL